ncbi:type IV pilin N-terminal domain-containing protein [Methanoculleus sp.]|uniref:type IV pilin N-terminal domain-containing protein n=1 Tax=Methanoculleus sp. TaxID=90427 RepID=UPI0025D473BF|nr:type IV pilin N-terminal domain-containing protein [Methanoculleus sp.]
MVCGERDGGVSEVVSTILMVAVVVILAAIVGSLVFGMKMPEEPKTVVVTATRSGDNVTFMNHGGMNMDRVSEIKCWIGGVGPGNDNITLGTRAGATNVTCNVSDATRVVVVGTFVDNESLVLLDKTL